MKKKHNNSQHTQNRVEQQISKQLSIILQQEVRDPRVGIVTITDVNITKDLSVAKIYITALNKETTASNTSNNSGNSKRLVPEKILNNMAGFLRTELASRIQMRSVPEIRFYYDNSSESGNRIELLLSQINDSKFDK